MAAEALSKPRYRWNKLMAIVLLAVLIVVLFQFTGLDASQFTPTNIKQFILSFGVLAPVIFVALYAARAVILVIPVGVMSLAGGLAFGKWWGTLLILLGGIFLLATRVANWRTVVALAARSGLGTDTTSALLVAAGDNPQRLRSEATFAHLCGVAPIDANTGKQQRRHRLNRGGDRQANSALWHIVITRMASDQRTRDYINGRLGDGLTKKEAIRCLKRHIAREVYHHLPHPKPAP